MLVSLATLVIAVLALVTMKEHFGGFQLVSDHTYTGDTLGIRWYLGIDGISIFLVLLTAVLFPLVLLTGQNKHRHAGLHGLDAPPRGGRDGQLPLVGPDRLLLLFRADPGAGVLRHRRVGPRPTGLRRGQVLPLHVPRLGLPARRDPRPGLHPPVPDRRAHLLAPGARGHPSVVVHGDPALPGVHGGLRRQGAAVPFSHVVTRRLHRSARRVDRSCCRVCWPSWGRTG